MVGHGGSSAGSYLADPTSPIPSHCASIVVTNTLRVNHVSCDLLHTYSIMHYVFICVYFGMNRVLCFKCIILLDGDI